MKFTQGFVFRYHVKDDTCTLILKSSTEKYIISQIEEVAGDFYLYADAQTTKTMIAGTYKYQLQDANGILEQGYAEILKNFALMNDDEEVKTRNQIILDAIQAQIAGKATSAQSSLSVGDKSISYYSINDLLKLRDYFKQKVDEQKGKSTKNGAKIKYVWSLR